MIAILGPTSSGKTALSIQVAKKYGLSIISCDSRQIYKYFDVGTGKIPINSNYEIKKAQDYYIIEGVKVFGYDIVDPDTTFSAFDFAKYYESVVKGQDKKYLLVGGTGFYAETALYGTSQLSSINPNSIIREKLKDYSADEILELLPADIVSTLNESEVKNKQRLIRKYEIVSEMGKLPKNSEYKSPTHHKLIILNGPNEYLYNRVDIWVETIWDKLLIETHSLIENDFRGTPPMNGIVYKTVVEIIDGKIDKDAAKQLIKFDLHKYIRRQKTWFKKYKDASIVDISIDNPYNEVENIVVKQLNAE